MASLRILLLLLLLCIPQSGQAAPDSNTIYTAALASAAAYDDKLSRFALIRLERQGWQIQRFTCQTELADSQFLLATQKLTTGGISRTVHILAFRGTDKHIKDIITDLAAELIFFYPSPTRLVTVTYNNKELSADVLAHRGFQAYAETALSVPVGDQDKPERSLVEELLTDKTASVIITGHSLGGAAATLYGAMLLERGVPSERLQVISFGAPPVANLGFSQRYGERLSLLRVINPYDLVAHMTGPAPDGAKRRPDYVEMLSYVHFGNVLTNPVSIQDELRQHPMRIYIDYAARARLPLVRQSQLPNNLPTASLEIVNTSKFSGGHSSYMNAAVQEIFAELLLRHGVAVAPNASDATDYTITVHIDGRQLEVSNEGNVSVSVAGRRRFDNTVVWVGSQHVSLLGEMSPLAGAILAADALSSQFPAETWQLIKEIPTFSPLKI